MVCPGTEFCSVSWSRSSKIPVGVHVEVFRFRDRAQHEVQRRCGADQDPGLSSSLENLDIICSCPLHLAVTRPGVHATVHGGIWENSTHFLREGGARAVRTRKSGYYFNELFIWRSGGGFERVFAAKCVFFGLRPGGRRVTAAVTPGVIPGVRAMLSGVLPMRSCCCADKDMAPR